MVGLSKTQALRVIELVECGIPLADAKAFARYGNYRERAKSVCVCSSEGEWHWSDCPHFNGVFNPEVM